MLDLLDEFEDSASGRNKIVSRLRELLVELSRGQSQERSQVERLEATVRANPTQAFQLDSVGFARLGQFVAGRFETPCISELRARAAEQARPDSKLCLWVLDGTNPLTDVGYLQATALPDSLFQVASQFNCLESPGPYLVPVADYFCDPTQGPRASISAFPGALLRHYYAPSPDGRRFAQKTEGPQVNLLNRVPQTVQSGYLLRPEAGLAQLLEKRFESVEIGLHEGLEVLRGANWDGPVEGRPLITQVFSSTLAAGGYGPLDLELCRVLLRAAYLGTLLAAASLGKARATLTLIGGGVFGNPIDLIWESILWAFDQMQPYLHRDLTVIVNGREIGKSIPVPQLRQAALARGGDVLVCRSWGFAAGSDTND